MDSIDVVVIGVDTHLDTHTATIVDHLGRHLGECCIPTTTAGYQTLLDWATATAPESRRVWAVEGTRHYGVGLTRHLLAAGETVGEIERAARIGKRRRGKSDPIDAERAAREQLARTRISEPRADGPREALRLLLIDHEHLTDTQRRAKALLASTLVTCPDAQRHQLSALTLVARLRACTELATDNDPTIAARHQLLRRLATDILARRRQLADINRQIRRLVTATTPSLLDQVGIGPINAARILLVWSHPGRVHSDAAFAALGGVCPIPASTGRTTRHRLNRGGDRQLNRALHSIASTRMRCDPTTRAYVQRRVSQGKTERDARRCLKRYIARQIHRHLTNTLDNT